LRHRWRGRGFCGERQNNEILPGQVRPITGSHGVKIDSVCPSTFPSTLVRHVLLCPCLSLLRRYWDWTLQLARGFSYLLCCGTTDETSPLRLVRRVRVRVVGAYREETRLSGGQKPANFLSFLCYQSRLNHSAKRRPIRGFNDDLTMEPHSPSILESNAHKRTQMHTNAHKRTQTHTCAHKRTHAHTRARTRCT
jgi:hypothetical protein